MHIFGVNINITTVGMDNVKCTECHKCMTHPILNIKFITLKWVRNERLYTEMRTTMLEIPCPRLSRESGDGNGDGINVCLQYIRSFVHSTINLLQVPLGQRAVLLPLLPQRWHRRISRQILSHLGSLGNPRRSTGRSRCTLLH
jgi:hypothetical protein